MDDQYIMTVDIGIIPHSKPWIAEEDEKFVNEVLHTGMISQGVLVEQFEQRVCNFLQINSGVATASGTSALLMALQALGISKGSEVILPTYVCRNVLDAVLTVGAKPVICDIGNNWVMTSEQVEPLLTEKTAAIIAVHIFGIAVDVQTLKTFGIPVIEDGCQAFGLNIQGMFAGSIGDLGIFSFHATKCLTTAEGGMLVSNNSNLILKARSLRDGGESNMVRTPAPLSDLQAALGLSQLKRYQFFLEKRKKIKGLYFSGLQGLSKVILPEVVNDFLFRFPLRIKMPFNELQAKMLEHNIQVRQGVDDLLHRQVGLSAKHYPNAVQLFNDTVSLPFYPALKEKEYERVINVIKDICK